MKYHAILYDLDGTLIDSVPMILESFQRAFVEVLGREESADYILSTIGLPLSVAFEPYEPATLREMLQGSYLKHNQDLLPTAVKTFPGIKAGLEELAAMGVRQGIVTSKRKEPALFSLNQLELSPFFEVVIGRDDSTLHKPDPTPIFVAMERLGLSNVAEVLYVGDSIHDLRCAKNAGMDVALVDWTYMPKDDLKRASPDYWLNQLSDISCILRGTEL